MLPDVAVDMHMQWSKAAHAVDVEMDVPSFAGDEFRIRSYHYYH